MNENLKKALDCLLETKELPIKQEVPIKQAVEILIEHRELSNEALRKLYGKITRIEELLELHNNIIMDLLKK